MADCEHVYCRMWSSLFDAWRGPGLVWCPRCGGEDTRIPDDPEPTDTAGPLRLARPASWWVRLTEQAGIEFGHKGPLTREQAREFARAVNEAGYVAEHVLMQLAGKPQTWQLEPLDDNLVVISRWRGLDWKVGLTLLPITPRKEARCDQCREAIQPGARAWRGSPAPAGMSSAEGASDFRFCLSCVNAMSPTPIGKTRGQGAVLRLVAGGEG